MGKLMKWSNLKGLSLAALCLSFPVVSAQISGELDKFSARYKDFPGIYDTREMNVEIKIKDGNPVSHISTRTSLFVLSDNSGYFNESKEYFTGSENLVDLNAYTLYPENNKYKKVVVRDFKKLTERSSGLYYDDLYAYIFNFPKVGKGSKLVTEHSVITSNPYIPIVFYFGENLPTEHAGLKLTVPRELKISYRLYGMDTGKIAFHEENKGKTQVYSWEVRELEDYSRDFIAPGHKYIYPHIIINIAGYENEGQFKSIMGSLDDQYSWSYSKISGLNLEFSEELKSLSDSLCQGLTTDEEKVKAIYGWVRNNIRYVAFEDGENGYRPREANLILQRRYGDCKDKSSLLYSLMQSQEIPSSYAWVGTRILPYDYSEFPSLSVDNHMVAVWWKTGDDPVVLDGTAEHHELYEVPAALQGKECLIHIDENNYRVFRIPVSPPAENLFSETLFIEMKDGILKGKADCAFTGENKANLLNAFEGKDESKYPFVVGSRMPKASNKFIVENVNFQNNLSSGEMNVHYEFKMPDYVSLNNDRIYLNMNLVRFLRELPVKEDRELPVEAEMTMIHRTACIFSIPEGYEIEFLPEKSSWKDPQFSYSIEYLSDGKSVTMQNEIMVDFLILEDERIHDFYNMLTSLKKAYLHSIILKKI